MKRVLVLFAAGSEELETISIVNILRRAGVDVTLAGLTDGPLKGSRDITLVPDTTLDIALQLRFDMVVLPGGQPGTRNLQQDTRVISLIKAMHEQGKYVCAICAAPMVLAAAGLLSHKRATCFPTCLDGYSDIKIEAAAIVEDGKIITSRGPGTAMDFALLLVERLTGKRAEVESGLVR